jgi:MBOAT, membrane-bound O-acyltransferase family
VYIRTGGSLIAVYSMSAFWHGFYPGYYLFFLSVPLLTVCERMARTKISPHFSSARWGWYGILGMLATSLIAEYMAVPFLLLAFDWSWDMWKSHYFFGHVVCVIGYAALALFPTPKAPVKGKLS